MRRGAKPAKAKVKAKPPIVRKSPKSAGSRVQYLGKRLAEAVEREAGARKRESNFPGELRALVTDRSKTQSLTTHVPINHLKC